MLALEKTTSPTQFYTWKNHTCAYEIHQPSNSAPEGISLLLIHPIGVGLSRKFWQRFCNELYHQGGKNLIYNPDLLGCGESDKPRIAYTPADWAKQLKYFLETVVQKPVILVVQGALFPTAVELVNSFSQQENNLIHGLMLSGPPAWILISKDTPKWQHKLAWNLFDSPFGNLFYRYARTEKFLRNFSTRQLFAQSTDVDAQWLETLQKGAENIDTRHAVYSFLSGFWRQDYSEKIAAIQQPTLVVMGETASTISKEAKTTSADERFADYIARFSQSQGVKIPGRNVLPYESTVEFVRVVSQWSKVNCQ